MRRKGRFPLPRPVAREEPAREDAVGGDADSQLAAGREDLLLDPARDERADRPGRAAEDLGRLDVGEVLVEPQDDRRTLALSAGDL